MARILMALFAILELICGSSTIDLLDTHSGFILRSWRPMAADAKGGGVWRDSPLADGRQLVQSTRGNIVDTFSFDARDVDQDATIHRIGDLRRWLQLAQDYWVGGDPSVQSSVPYIRARGANETYIRYALVYRGACLEENNPYDQPFFGIHCQSAQPALTLALEHGDWLDTTPGSSGTCVQVAGTGLGQDIVTVTASPAQSSDDGVNFDTQTALNLAATQAELGYEPVINSASALSFVRFTNVAVPQGATILDAYITFTAEDNDANDVCAVTVRIEETDDAATFSTYPNLMARLAVRPSLPVLRWPDPSWGTSIEHWTAGGTYTTQNDCALIRRQVQGIVDRPGWASGNAMAFFFQDAGSTQVPLGANRTFRTFDNLTGPPPELTVVYVNTSSTFGRAATCNDEVYVANKHNLAQLTNIFVFDADLTSYTEVIGAALPTNLLPAAPANGDIIYFGISTADPDMSGPFSSLVFDIGTAASYTAAATITWQYWNGGWVALTVRDNTASIPTGSLDPFVQTGVNSVHWRQPSDWATTTVNGVTGYWVRALVTIGGGDAVTTPTQANRNIYTVTWPYVDIAAAQVGGDLSALARIYRTNESGINFANPTLYYDRVLVGLRTLSRGSRYTPYINFADEQNDPGITVSPAAAAAFAADVETPTGRRVTWTSPGASGAVAACNINFASDLMEEYHGTYHVFLRAEQETGTTVGQIEVRLEYGFPGGREIQTPYQAFEYVGVRQYLDFGRVTIPSAQIAPGETSASCYIQVYVSYSASGVDLYLYDLILMPADEWLGAFDIATSERFRVGEVGYFGSRRYLDIDSIAYPRRFLRALVYNEAGIIYNYRCIANGPAILQSNVAQRLWFFTTRHTSDSTSQVASDWEESGRVQAFRQQRYFGMRGGR